MYNRFCGNGTRDFVAACPEAYYVGTVQEGRKLGRCLTYVHIGVVKTCGRASTTTNCPTSKRQILDNTCIAKECILRFVWCICLKRLMSEAKCGVEGKRRWTGRDGSL